MTKIRTLGTITVFPRNYGNFKLCGFRSGVSQKKKKKYYGFLLFSFGDVLKVGPFVFEIILERKQNHIHTDVINIRQGSISRVIL